MSKEHFIHDIESRKQRIAEKRELILNFMGSEAFSTTEIIACLLKQTRQSAYLTLKKMERDQLVKHYQLNFELAKKGTQNIWGLTPTGSLLADEEESTGYFEAGRISPISIAHSLQIQRVRIFATENGYTSWKSSRKIKQLAISNKKIWLQVPDAIAVNSSGEIIAFEIERTAKTLKRYEEILSNYGNMILAGTVNRVYYISPHNITARLEKLFIKINKVNINGKVQPVHEKLRERVQFFDYEEWSK